jgi:hypothetical protein
MGVNAQKINLQKYGKWEREGKWEMEWEGRGKIEYDCHDYF